MGSSDAPAALVMGAGMLGFGLTMILRPGHRLADSWKQGSWHPYKMPFWALCAWQVWLLATVASLFFYIAYVAWHR